MAKEFYLGENTRKDIAETLSQVLADSYTLYLKTHNFHWNVEGPNFRELHLMFEEQYSDLAAAVDEIAERIRALGHYAPGSYAQFSRLTRIEETDNPPDAETMVRRLSEDHGLVSKRIQEALPALQEAGDEGTVDLLIGRMKVHDKTAWMLRSLLK